MKMRFFDFEVLPHWWLCVFGDYPDNADDVTEDIKSTFTVINSDMPNARDLLIQLLREQDFVQVGYNIKGYDLPISNGVYQGFTPEQIKIINDIIINPSAAYYTKEHLRLSPFVKRKLSNVAYQDLMDDGVGSLKEKEAVLGLNILESDVDFNKEDLTDEDKEDLTIYCKQDVFAAMYFFKLVVNPYTNTKLALGKTFNIDEKTVRASTNARLVSIVLQAKRKTFSDAEKVEIELPEKIKQYCYDNLPYNILEQIRTSAESFTVKLFNNTVSFGNGGIHSTYAENLYVESDDEWCLVNVDATSYYPSIMIQFDCLSRAITNPSIFTKIFDERVRIKHKKDKTKEDEEAQLAYKLVLNTTFGASGNKWLDTYDPHMCTKVCRVGQIFLASLACKISKTINGAKIIQSNTDGILVYCRRKDLTILKSLMGEWTAVSGINMEDDYVDKIWQRDVNNYLLVTDKGKVKRKGAWLMDTWEKPGYVMVGALTAFACAKAVTQYLLQGTDIVQSIVANKNVTDFVMTCKKGPSYSRVVQRFADGTEKELFKCNRVIATKDENAGMIYKIKKYKDRLSYTQMANIPEHCKLVNEDLSTYNFEELQKELDYMYYINRCADLLDIQWYQIKGLDVFATNKFDYFNQ
jgi:hypothetical protein